MGPAASVVIIVLVVGLGALFALLSATRKDNRASLPPPRWQVWKRLTPTAYVMLVGLLLLITAGVSLYLAVRNDSGAMLVLAGVSTVAGLMTGGYPIRAERNTHGTKIWQNDGSPIGGGGAGGI
jgi:hypothetical protein